MKYGNFVARALGSRGWMTVLGVLLTFPSAANAAVPYDTPVYNPASKSYVELVLIKTTKYSYRNSPDIRWEDAAHLATEMSYKGARGHLAVVNNIETHEFLLRSFQPSVAAWIGLRYWCGVNRLEDVTGRSINKGMFQIWAQPWDHSARVGCLEYKSDNKVREFMPVYYLPVNEGFRWAAQGWHKAYYAFFVEFPTGAP
jgi:Lectin C-type domain